MATIKTTMQVTRTIRNLWVVRHGERIDKVDPEWIKTAPRGAWDDPPLTEKGVNQAKEAGKRLRDEEIDYIFCSPFIRCLQTATAIVGELKENAKLKLFVEPGFVEDLSITQFPPGCLSAKDLHNDFKLIDANYDSFLKDFLPEDNEYVCEKRIRSTIENLLDKYPGNVLIISHGSPIAAIHTVLGNTNRDIGYCAISHFVVTQTTESLPTHNGEVQHDLHKKYKFKCILAGDMKHLSDPTTVVYPVVRPDDPSKDNAAPPTPMKAPS
uniref:Phosphoglycerate mutase n=1 Tax=Panagrolaimus sp. PS1159 TaxID=55785 RepID=A0AC35F7C2_9BILA